MLKTSLNPLPIIGKVEPSFIKEVAEQFPNAGTTVYRKPRGRTAPLMGLVEILQPVTDQLMEHPDLKIKREPFMVRYYTQTMAIKPGGRAIAVGWHTDSNTPSAIFSDTFTTEVLAEDEENPFNYQARYQRNRKLFGRATPPTGSRFKYLPTDDELKDIGLKVERAEPGELALLQDEVHRPPVNHTEEDIIRNWIQIVILKN